MGKRRRGLWLSLPTLCLLCLLGVAALPAMLGAQTPLPADLTVDARHVENHIDPHMYAAFVEMMAEDVKWGLTAEMLHDRSFEEAPNYLGLPADWKLEPDTRNDNVAAITFASSTAEAYPLHSASNGALNHSLRVTLAPGDITDTRRGFSQGRLSVVAGQTYKGSLWLKLADSNGYTGSIIAALEEDNTNGATYALAVLSGLQNSTAWQQVKFALTPKATDRFAKLTLLFPGKGTLFLDQISLEPASARGQVRADTEAMIAELHPSFLRWPGGNVAQDYHWQWGIGPRDLRPTWTNKSWSNAPEPGDFGTDEYLAFCERLGIEPSITINVGGDGATPEEAAAWVDYVNGPASSKYGALRAANGHPAPYGVERWELGNEIFGNWVRGHVSGEEYAREAVRYAQAMRAVDPSLTFTAVGMGIMPGQDAWNTAVLKIAGSSIDYLAIHDYTSKAQNSTAADPRAEMMARAAQFEASYLHTADLIREISPEHSVRQIVNEWNLFYDAETIQSMTGAVYAARRMNGFERDGDTVAANSISDLLNGWVGGVVQASRDRIYGTSQFWALKMYSDALGTDRLQSTLISPELAPGTKAIDAVATRTADGTKTFIKLSNADAAYAIDVTLHLQGQSVPSVATEVLFSAQEAAARNSFETLGVLIPRSERLQCSRVCHVVLPPDSVAVLTFQR